MTASPASLPGKLCPGCGYRTAASPHRCPDCGTPLTPASLTGRGRVWSWTVVHPDGSGPYGLAHIDLADGPRLLTRFDHNVRLRCGTPVLVDEVAGLPVAHPQADR